MKIDGTYTAPNAGVTGRTQARPNAETKQSTASVAVTLSPEAQSAHVTDAVTLSPQAANMLSGQKPPISDSRISAIKEAIARGEFSINSEAIADGLIDTARELLQSQQQPR